MSSLFVTLQRSETDALTASPVRVPNNAATDDDNDDDEPFDMGTPADVVLVRPVMERRPTVYARNEALSKLVDQLSRDSDID